jgi:hypothetical protein
MKIYSTQTNQELCERDRERERVKSESVNIRKKNIVVAYFECQISKIEICLRWSRQDDDGTNVMGK